MNVLKTHWGAVLAMTLIVVAANVGVQYPMFIDVGPLQLADILTYGAFVYPFAFLITDITNRLHGPTIARRVVYTGFATAVVCSIIVPTLLFNAGLIPYSTGAARISRIAIASGTAFLVAQLLDIFIFNRLRGNSWWRAPAASSVSGSVIDTIVFFAIAFAPIFVFLGPNDGFALEDGPLFGLMATDAPRWVSWALGDMVLKLLIAAFALVPYRIIIGHILPPRQIAT